VEIGHLLTRSSVRPREAPAPDTLAVSRGYAYAAGRTADDIAGDLVERRLQPEQLRQDAGSDR